VPTAPGDQGQLAECFKLYASIPVDDLWCRYFALGGMATSLELGTRILGSDYPTAHEYNLIAIALNEHFMEVDPSLFVPYMEDEQASN
jgi:hypothetical protein